MAKRYAPKDESLFRFLLHKEEREWVCSGVTNPIKATGRSRKQALQNLIEAVFDWMCAEYCFGPHYLAPCKDKSVEAREEIFNYLGNGKWVRKREYIRFIHEQRLKVADYPDSKLFLTVDHGFSELDIVEY